MQNRVRQGGLKRTVESLSALIGEDREERTIGLTQAIREVFQAYYEKHQENPGIGLSARGVRKQLEETGFQIDNYKNPMAVIHTTLKRLEDQGEIKPNEKFPRFYLWVRQEISDDEIPF